LEIEGGCGVSAILMTTAAKKPGSLEPGFPCKLSYRHPGLKDREAERHGRKADRFAAP